MLALSVFANHVVPAAAQSLADTDDVLDGTRYLVRADDLVVADPILVDPFADPPTTTEVAYFRLPTEDMVITASEDVSPRAVVAPPCVANPSVNTPFPQQTQLMRMFDLPYDVIVTLAPTSTTGGAGCANGQPNNMTFYIHDPSTGADYTKSVGNAGMTNRWLHTAVADFNGDGLDDLFIISDEWAYVATAHDTTSPADGVTIRSSLKFDQTPMADPAVGDFNADGNLDIAWMGASFTSGATPVVHFATVCTGPVAGTICAGDSSFTIKASSATISPAAPTGSIVTVGGDCTKNDNNRSGSELRSPAMAVAAGQYDGSPGDELLVAALYEDSGKECKVVAEVYSFTTFTGSGTTGQNLSATREGTLDNLGPHGHIASPASIYAASGRLDWSASKDNVALAISGGTEHNVMVISFTDGLLMTSRDHPFDSGNVNKSFAGLTIGRFSSAPAADASTSCNQDSQCTDTCKSSVCEISGADCTADGDCAGVCTTDGVCSYIKPSNYDLQVAAFLMARNSDDHESLVYIYSADPIEAFAPKQLQHFNVTNFGNPSMDRGFRGGSLLRAGDLQGRSQRLGTPTVIHIETNIQPDLIVGVPPMHADWLSFGGVGETQFCEPTGDCPTSFSPSNICNCTDPLSNTACPDGSELRCLFNFSSLAGTYTSRYEFDESEKNQSESTETTSWSLGLSVDLSGKVKSLTPEGAEVTQSIAFAAENSYDHSVSKTNSSFKTVSFNASTSTGFYDHVWYTARDYSVFYYPVIGQTVCVDSCQENGACSISGFACEDDADCPNDFTECPDADKQPLYVQYSGASSLKSFSDDGGNLEWYQPVHEPGQILSYPWDCDQLASRNGVNICDEESSDYSLLSEAASFSTDTTEQEYKLSWSGGGETSQTVDKGGQFSQKLTWTRTESTPEYEESEEGLKFKQSVSINANEAVSTSRTNKSSLDSSTGITVARPGTFLTPGKFAYLVEGYIFGDAPAPGTLDDLTPTGADVQTNGVLRSAFTVDPRAGGSWWEGAGPYKLYVDVALNRPVHLKPDPGVGVSAPGVTNCLPVSDDNISTADCVADYRADPTPKGLFNSQFYWLRGFFVTPADAVGQGPQLGQANEGDVLALQVRVYNYSLQDMSLGTIKVDFYAQEWDPQCNTPAGYYNHNQSCTQPGGGVVPCENSCDPCCIANETVDSIFIGQDVLDPLPGFDSPNHPGQANWTVATTTFDTGAPSICGSRGCGDKDFLFWVVVWPELADNNGNPALRAELPDHSLTGIPGQLESIADICTKDNDCVDGTCRATRGACVADTDCPSAEDNVCASNGTCAISGKTCASNGDCGECLCEICLDEFSNNVGFFHQAFVINPPSTSTTSAPRPSNGSGAGSVAGDLAIEHVSVTPASVRPGEDAVVRVGLRAVGARIDGQLVRFYAVPPDAAHLSVEEVFEQIRPFDVETLSRIRADRVHQAQAPFFTRQVGTHQILVSALVGGEEVLIGSAELEVGTSPPPTPTMAEPTATPTSKHDGSSDDGCTIAETNGDAPYRLAVLLLMPLLLGLLRSRRGGGVWGRCDDSFDSSLESLQRPPQWSTLLIVLVGAACSAPAAAQTTSSAVMLSLGNSVTKGVVGELTSETLGWATSALGLDSDPNAEVVKALEEISMQLSMIEDEIAQTNVLLQESLCQDAAGDNTLTARRYIDTLMSEGPSGFQGIVNRAQEGIDVTNDLDALFDQVLNGEATNPDIETLLNEMHDTLMDAGLSQGGITACVRLLDPPSTVFDDRFYYQDVKNFLDFFFAYQAEGATLLVNAYHWLAVKAWVAAGNDPNSLTQDEVAQICQSPTDNEVLNNCEKAVEAFNLVADNLRLQYAHAGAPYSSGTPNDSTATFQFDASDPEIEIDVGTGLVWVRNYYDFCRSAGYSSTCCASTSASPCGPGVGAYNLSTFSKYDSSDAVDYGNTSDWHAASGAQWTTLLADWTKGSQTLSTYLTSGPPGFTGGTDQRVFFTGDTNDSATEVTVNFENDKLYHFRAEQVACFVATPLKHDASAQPFCEDGIGELMSGAKDHTNSNAPCFTANAEEHGELSAIQSPFFDLLYNIQEGTCKAESHPDGQTFYAGPPGWLLKYRSYRTGDSGGQSQDTGVVSLSSRASQFHWPVRDSSKVTCTDMRTRTNLSGQGDVPTLCGADFDAWFDKWVIPPPDIEEAPQVTTPASLTVAAPPAPESSVPHHEVTVPVDFAASLSAVDREDGDLPVHCVPAVGSRFQIGVTEVACSATDSAGNTKTATFDVHVVYPFSGFEPPLDSPREVAAGSNVAIRFGLGGDRGDDVLEFDGPASGQADCDTGDLVTVATAAESDRGLRYDARSETYEYDWATDPDWAGQCRRLVIDLVDGTSQSALVRFEESGSGGGNGGCTMVAPPSAGLLPLALGLLLPLARRLRPRGNPRRAQSAPTLVEQALAGTEVVEFAFPSVTAPDLDELEQAASNEGGSRLHL